MLIIVGSSVVFFFFSSRRRHTRFDCDWSSDVCSSDLERLLIRESNHRVRNMLQVVIGLATQTMRRSEDLAAFEKTYFERLRSEERRVGKECRSRRWPYH